MGCYRYWQQSMTIDPCFQDYPLLSFETEKSTITNRTSERWSQLRLFCKIIPGATQDRRLSLHDMTLF